MNEPSRPDDHSEQAAPSAGPSASAAPPPPAPPPPAPPPPAPPPPGQQTWGSGVGYPPPPPAPPAQSGPGFGGFVARTLTVVLAVPLGLVATVVTFGIVAAILVLAVGDEPLELVGDPAPGSQQVREVPLDGIIADGELAATGGFLDADLVAEALEDAVDDDDVAAVVLPVSSPGGTAVASFVIADAISDTRAAGLPVVVHGRGEVTSGAAILAAEADRTLLNSSTLFGSYGVILGPFRRYDDPVAVHDGALVGGVETEGGVTEESITAGRGKDALSPYVDPDDETMDRLQEAADLEYARIVDHVAEGRGIDEDVLVDELGAAIIDAEVAVENGVADDLTSRDEAREVAADLADADEFEVRRVPREQLRESTLLGDFLGGGLSALVGGAEQAGSCLREPAVLAYRGDPATLRCE